MLKRKPRQPKPTRFPKPCQPRPTRFQPNYEKMNAVVRDSMIGYVFKEKTRLRKTNDGGWGVDVAPRLSGGPPTHPLVGVHKTSPNMTNKNHSKAHFFLA